MLFAEARSEDLQQFLTKELEPICDADPDVLAQYVLALLKNNKPSSKLQVSVNEQLEDFLKDQTQPFVSKLFSVLESGRFMEGASAGPNVATASSGSQAHAESDQNYAESRRSRHHESSEDEDDDDRNFKHRRQRSEPRDDDTRSGEKRRHDESESTQINKYMRDSQDMRRMNNGQQQDGRGRGRGGARGRGGRPRQQCRDYNERGFCMRGDSCPYDHGTDRIILDDRALKGQYGGHAPPSGMPPNIGQPPFYGAPNAFAGMPPGNEGFPAENAGFPGGRPEPSGPGMEGGAPFQSQRGARGGRGGPRGRGRGGFAASGGRSHHNRHNSTIIVENIPPEHCVIDKVNEYFKQFGTITNISLQPETSKAVIQYSNHAEADAAYSSPEVIFNNRFVKVYWQKAESKDQESAAVTTPPKPAQPKTFEPSPEVVAAKAAEFAKLKEAKAKQQQARMQTMLELQKSKEQLIQKQIEEQKMLMEKLANAKTPEERTAIKEALNNIMNGSSSPAPAPTSAPIAEAQDVPTEVTQTEDGKKEETAEDLKAKLARLEAEAAALGLHGAAPRGRGRGRGGYYAARGRGSWPRGGGVQKSYRLDNRTTKLMVKNLPQEENEKLRQHFEQFGQLESVSYKDDIGSLVVQFKNRREAEVALARGANTLQGNALEMAWYNEPASESSNRESSAPSEGGSQIASPAAEVVSSEPVVQQQ